MNAVHKLEILAPDCTTDNVSITLDGVQLRATRVLLEMLPDKLITATITVLVAPDIHADVIERVFVDTAQREAAA